MAHSSERAGGLTIASLIEQTYSARIPHNRCFSYFSAIPLSEDELRDYLEEPIAALPPALQDLLPPVFLLLVPYLSKRNGAEETEAHFEEVPPKKSIPYVTFAPQKAKETTLVLATKSQDLSDYHYSFYRGVAEIAYEVIPEEGVEQFRSLLRQELANDVNGEVGEQSWNAKQALLRRKSGGRRDSKLFRAYAGEALIDTLSLYLHGICCDIDVEPGPRQLRSRYLRKRLELLEEMFPPPEGYCVFPEDLRQLEGE